MDNANPSLNSASRVAWAGAIIAPILLGFGCLAAIFFAPAYWLRTASSEVKSFTDRLTANYVDVTDQWNFKTTSGSRYTVATHSRSGKHSKTVTWGPGPLSDLVISADVKATMAFTVSMNRTDWRIEARKGRQGNIQLRVSAPPLTVDPSDIHVDVVRITTVDGSPILNKEKATNELLKSLHDDTYPEIANSLLRDVGVRESARKSIAAFILDWVAKAAGGESELNELELSDIVVRFPDEPSE